jgi:hypothetical protein
MNTYTMYAIIALILGIGLFRLFNISFIEYCFKLYSLFRDRRKKNKRRNLKFVIGEKKQGFISNYTSNIISVLRYTGKENVIPTIAVASVLLFGTGIFISLYMNNMTLLPVLSIGLAILPIIYVNSIRASFINELHDNLETALQLISNSYITNENIILSVESNLNHIKAPLTKIFTDFVVEVNHINTNIPTAVLNMKSKLNNRFFHEWCDTLIQCNDNKTLKYVPLSIINKLHDMRTVQVRLDTKIAPTKRDVNGLLLVTLLSVPTIYILNNAWYESLVNSLIGKLVVTIVVIICIGGYIYSSFVLKPEEYL